MEANQVSNYPFFVTLLTLAMGTLEGFWVLVTHFVFLQLMLVLKRPRAQVAHEFSVDSLAIVHFLQMRCEIRIILILLLALVAIVYFDKVLFRTKVTVILL